MDFISVPIIVLCCYMVGEVYKVIFKKNTEKYKLIPIIVAVIGGLMGVLIYYTAPEVIFNVSDVYSALMIGIMSGFASTGTNQILKQNLEIEKKEKGKNE